MRPKNSSERRNAFIRFILFYVITTALIVTAVFFGLQVPFKENRQLQSQLEVVHRERNFERKLYDLISNTRRMLDTVNKAGTNTAVVEGRIIENIKTMDAMINKDSTSAKMIYSELVSIFTEATSDKKLIRSSSDKDETVRIKDEQIQELKKNILGWKDAFDRQQAQLTQLQNRQ